MNRMSAADYRAMTAGAKPRRKTPRPRPSPPSLDALPPLAAGPKVVLPYPPVACSPNWHGARWIHLKAKKQYRADCALLAIEAGFARHRQALAAGPVKVTIRVDFFPPRAIDNDNGVAAFKAGQDGLADALRIDDGRFDMQRVDHPAGGNPCVVVTLLGIGEDAR